VLFQWLIYGDDDNDKENCLSPPLHLTYIDLTGSNLGNMGFGALVGWLEHEKKKQEINMSLSSPTIPDGIRELSLQNNHIDGTAELALSFVSAFSFHNIEPPFISSSLSCLNLSSNPLSCEFKQALFSSLASLASLRVLFLNMTGLNKTDAGALAAYISECRLTQFHASGNYMGYSGIKKILKAVERCWTLERVEMYANDIGDRGDSDDDTDDGNREIGSRRFRLEQKLESILSRNGYLKGAVRDQAFELLRYSRLLLLNRHSYHDRSHSELDLLVELVGQEGPHQSSCMHNHKCECLPIFYNPHSRAHSPAPIDRLHASDPHFPFTRLPIEIQLNILSLLAPILSSSQQIRIFEHAIDKATLPDLTLRLPPSNGGGRRVVSGGRGGLTRARDSTRIKCSWLSNFIAPITKEKQKWLELVGCDAYDQNE